MRAFAAWSWPFVLPLAGCLQVGTGSGTDAGAGSTAADSGAASGDSGAGGTGCGNDPQSGVTLCLATNACPGLAVDPGAFPGCGFRQGGPSELDLECACAGGQLCPIGVPTSCGAAAQLLEQQQSALTVCQQVSTGSCIGADAGSGSGGSSGGTTTLSGACMACLSGCGSTPACYQACGC